MNPMYKTLEIELSNYDYNIVMDISQKLQVDARYLFENFVCDMMREYYEDDIREQEKMERDYEDDRKDREIWDSYINRKEAREEQEEGRDGLSIR